jgi:surface polysaccharide O-acyltransferase-like enzyme
VVDPFRLTSSFISCKRGKYSITNSQALLLVELATDSDKKMAIPDDLIRTLGIIFVIMLHSSNEALQSQSLPASYWWTGAVYKTLSLSCVPLFVMLSGALLLQPSKLNEPIRVFLKKRVSRIGFAFTFWTAFYIAWGFYTTQHSVTLGDVGQSVLKSTLTGAYYHFWFIYLIAGLYLITPIIRVIVSNANSRIVLRYLILLWFAGVAVLPIIQLASGLVVNSTLFAVGGWIGYYILGTYLQKMKLRSSILYAMLGSTFVWTLAGVWLMNYPLSSMGQNYFFFDYLSANAIIGSVALFMILLKFSYDWPGSSHMVLKNVVQAISRNTLPIYLFHIIILESLQRGFFGFTLSATTLNPIVEIPIITASTLFVTLGLILLMRKVPVLKKLIG